LLLLVTGKDDLTADYLIRRLDERNQPFFRFNTEDFLCGFDVSLRLENDSFDFTITDQARASDLHLHDIRAAYFRKPRVPTMCADQAGAEQLFNRREVLETLRSIWRLIPDRCWLNTPEALWVASNKVKQLRIASDLGFKIPSTLVSSSADEVAIFGKRHGGDVIAKAVKHGFLESDSLSLIFTSPLEATTLDAMSDGDSIIPAIVQPRLEKEFDLRITVVGDSIFPAAILSQGHKETSVDWRTWDMCGVDLEHRRANLPAALGAQCLELNRRLNLRFSCIDMVVTKDGEYYFLEVNPNGQWAWIEGMLNFPIRDSIIDLLLPGESS
jgi:hypothetical protein